MDHYTLRKRRAVLQTATLFCSILYRVCVFMEKYTPDFNTCIAIIPEIGEMATEELIAELISMVRALSFCTLAFVHSLHVNTGGRIPPGTYVFTLWLSVLCMRSKTWLAARVSLRLARLPRIASSAQRSRRLRSTRAWRTR